jgi:hypothetical protein
MLVGIPEPYSGKEDADNFNEAYLLANTRECQEKSADLKTGGERL